MNQPRAHSHRSRLWLRRIALFLLAAGLAAQPVHGRAQTAQPSPASVPSAPATPETAETTNPPTLASPIPVPGVPTLPAISDTTNPAALDYVIQYPMFGYLPFRKDLADKGIELIAHYISETMSNTRGVKGTGTAYAQQVDAGASLDLDKLGVWSDAVARFAMTDRAGA